MTDTLEAIRILLLIVFATAGLVIYLLIYNILVEKGYKLSDSLTSITNLIDFSDLIYKTKDHSQKASYKILFRSLLVFLFLLIGTIMTFLIDLKNIDCRHYHSYLKSETIGKVMNKYRNKENHNQATLTIDFDGETFDNTDLTSAYFNFYDTIKIGDVLKKMRGDSILYIMRDGQEIKIIKSRKDYCKN